MTTALVTGATSGIGAAFVRQLAARGDNLVLVARDTERLEALATELRDTYRVQAEVLTADLSIDDDVTRVCARLASQDDPIDVLVNNAGMGLYARLTDVDNPAHYQAFDVMVKAVFRLGGTAAGAMKERGHGLIINTGSTSGYYTAGNYSAIKAWVNNYTESLAAELHGTGVQVLLLAPGWVRTEFHSRAGKDNSSLPDAVFNTPEEIVAEALADADRGKVISIPTHKWETIAFLANHVAPRSVIRWASRKINSSRGK